MTGDFAAQPVVLVFGDSAAARARGAMAAEAAGWRLGCALDVTEALDRLDLQAGVDAVLIELEGAGNGRLDALLDRIERDAGAGSYRAIIAFPPHAIDAVAARSLHAELLCDPDPIERAAALAMALAGRGSSRLGEESAGDEAERLRRLGETVARIARTLAGVSAEALGGRSGAGLPGALDLPEQVRAEPGADMVRAAIRARRLRDRFFDSGYFADPGWDMLLDLMAARIEGRAVAISSLCIAAHVPPTTALRWIRMMTEAGLFVRAADPADGRRVFIALAAGAAEGMTGYFAAVRGLGAMMV